MCRPQYKLCAVNQRSMKYQPFQSFVIVPLIDVGWAQNQQSSRSTAGPQAQLGKKIGQDHPDPGLVTAQTHYCSKPQEESQLTKWLAYIVAHVLHKPCQSFHHFACLQFWCLHTWLFQAQTGVTNQGCFWLVMHLFKSLSHFINA